MLGVVSLGLLAVVAVAVGDLDSAGEVAFVGALAIGFKTPDDDDEVLPAAAAVDVVLLTPVAADVVVRVDPVIDDAVLCTDDAVDDVVVVLSEGEVDVAGVGVTVLVRAIVDAVADDSLEDVVVFARREGDVDVAGEVEVEVEVRPVASLVDASPVVVRVPVVPVVVVVVVVLWCRVDDPVPSVDVCLVASLDAVPAAVVVELVVVVVELDFILSFFVIQTFLFFIVFLDLNCGFYFQI